MKRLIAIIMLLVLLPGCGWNDLQDVEDLEAKAQSERCVHGASSMTKICVADAGVFYIDSNAIGKLLCYYDYDSDAKFVLCSAPECSHSDEECAAFRPAGVSIDGFACYDGALFLLQEKQEELAYQLIRMDVNCQNQTVLATLGSTDGGEVSGISDSYYCGGYAWVHANYERYDKSTNSMEFAQQLMAICLADGKITPLTDLLTEADGLRYLSFAAISDTAAAWDVECYAEQPMSQQEYLEQTGEIEGFADYLEQFYDNAKIERTWWIVSLADFEPTTIPFPGDLLTDFYQGQCLGLVQNGEVETEILYDPSTGEVRELFSIQNGGCLARYQGEIFNLLYEGDGLLYMEPQEDGKVQVSCYSLSDGSSAPLFEDDETITFRIIGETKDRLIGTIGTNATRVWIWKSDYWKGDWRGAKTILPGG